MDHLLQDLRHAVRALTRTPGFTLVTVITLALGIGANTAIFSIVNGVVLQPLGYPKPEQLMFLTSRFPAQGFDQFWVSPPEFFEFRELNQSFAEVGAFTTGEVNLMAARSATPRALGRGHRRSDARAAGAAGAGPAVREGRDRRDQPARAAGHAAADAAAGGHPVPRAVAVRLRRTRGAGPDGGDQRPGPRGHRHHAARCGCHGQPHRGLAAARPQPRQPSEPRQPLSSISSDG